MFNGFSLNSIQSAYIGSTPISSIYYGSQKIWPSTPPTPPPYERQYLTFEAIQPTTFSFSTNALQYSLDNGSTWTTLTAGNNTPQLAAGDKILWKQTGLTSSSGIGKFSATGQFNAYGNIMSLYYGDNFVGQTSLAGKTAAFSALFSNNTYIVNAENLILPATRLINQCYVSMFSYCTALTTAPKLPATTLENFCYAYMFTGCTALRTAPELPAITLRPGCYYEMFRNCTHLNYIKCLATIISASDCTKNWVRSVSNVGTFVKNASMTSWTTGNNGIPSNWTRQDA